MLNALFIFTHIIFAANGDMTVRNEIVRGAAACQAKIDMVRLTADPRALAYCTESGQEVGLSWRKQAGV